MAARIDAFAGVVRKCGGRVLHCPSATVDTYYGTWPQRIAMKKYPLADVVVSEEMRPVEIPLDTSLTAGCPDVPVCQRQMEYTKEHKGITIHSDDLISDKGQEIYNFIISEGVECVLISGVALNMCVMGRPFGVISLVELGVKVRIVADLVDVYYAPREAPYITIEQAKWFALGYIQAKWCSMTTCHEEVLKYPQGNYL